MPLVVSAFGPKAAEVAARIGDGLWITGVDPEQVERFTDAGGRGPVYSQLGLCWAPTTEEAIDTAHRVWPNTAVPGQLSQDLRTPQHFAQAARNVSRQMIADSVACGPDPAAILQSVQDAVAAGIDHVYLHQIGPDQEGFLRFWRREIAPALGDLRGD